MHEIAEFYRIAKSQGLRPLLPRTMTQIDIPRPCDGKFPIDNQHLDVIEASADQILADIGMLLQGDPATLDLCREKGFAVEKERVRFDGPTLRSIIRESAPATINVRARNPKRDNRIGNHSEPVLAPVYGPPNVRDTFGNRTMGGLHHYRSLVELAHASPALSNTGHLITVMHDVPEVKRPFQMALAHLELSDKPFMGPVSSPADLRAVSLAVRDIVGQAPGPGSCNLLHLINSMPPLTFKGSSLPCLREAASRGEGVIVTSYMMLGATGPVTLAAALAQGYAETLVGIALCQLWNPGTPVIMGIVGTPFDMRHMIPAFGDPTSSLIQMYAVALARRLGVPSRGDGGVTSAKIDDAQAGYEGGQAAFFARASGANFVLHSAGWMEQGRTVCMTKLHREAAAISNTTGLVESECARPITLETVIVAQLRSEWGLTE